MKRVAVAILVVFAMGAAAGCRVYSSRHPGNSSQRASCAQALKYGWCGEAYRQCREKPPGCKRELGIQR